MSNFMDLTAKTWSEMKNFRMTKMNTFSDAVTSIFDPWYWKACQHRDTTTLNVRAKFKNNQLSVFWVIPLTLFIPRVVVSTCNDNPSDTEDMISTIAFNLFRGVYPILYSHKKLQSDIILNNFEHNINSLTPLLRPSTIQLDVTNHTLWYSCESHAPPCVSI